MPASLNADQTRLLRMRAQGLHPETAKKDTARTVKAVGGIQAQDMPAAELSIRARSHGLTAEAVRKTREQDRSIVLAWLMRGTMHLVASDDFGWMQPFFGAMFIRNDERRFKQLGLTPEFRRQSSDLMREALAGHEGMTRAEVAAVLSKWGIPTGGQAIVHLLAFAASEGVICFGAYRGREPTYVLLDDWLPERAVLRDEQVVIELARRYLSAYAPAAPADFASWAGISLKQARAGFEGVDDPLVSVEIDGKTAIMFQEQAQWLGSIESNPVVRLLPAYDTYLLGYASRDFMLADEHARKVHPGGGIIHPTLIVNGSIAGTWRKVKAKQGVTVQVTPFLALGRGILPLLEAEVQDIGRFLAVETKLEVKTA